MDNEISAGVKIILERCKTNPEEMIDDYGKWGQLRDAVYDYVERGERRAWVRGLRPDEIDLLYKAFSAHARQIFDDYVMKQVLEGDEEKQPLDAYRLSQGKRVIGKGGTSWNDSWEAVKVQTSNTSIANQSLIAKLRQELGIK